MSGSTSRKLSVATLARCTSHVSVKPRRQKEAERADRGWLSAARQRPREGPSSFAMFILDPDNEYRNGNKNNEPRHLSGYRSDVSYNQPRWNTPF